MSEPSTKVEPPLPLSALLHDFALIRAHDLDLHPTLSETTASTGSPEVELEVSLKRSVEFISHARAALKMKSSGELEKLGVRIERIRAAMEDVLQSLPSEDEDPPNGL